MPDAKTPVLGQDLYIAGDITQNTWVQGRLARDLETSLGFEPGRLSAGWWILLLKETLAPADFKFSGITLRSGGRLGLPGATQEIDRARPHVSDEILRERGPEGYAALQKSSLARIRPTGPERLVKVLPVTRHSSGIAPNRQYPMGAGGLQWTLLRPCRFLVAAMVDGNGIATLATSPPSSMFFGASAPYEARAKMARFLDQA